MDIKSELVKEHSKKQCVRIVSYIGADPKRFGKLMDLFFNSEYRISQRAAWPVSYSVRLHPELAKPYLKKFIDGLQKKNVHPAVIRNTLRFLEEMDIPKLFHGKIMNICFQFIQSNDTPAAIKAYAITILEKLIRFYPEVKNELQLLLKDKWDYESAAFRSRAKRLL